MYRNHEQALILSLSKIFNTGNEVTVRGMTTREILGCSFSVKKPKERMLFIPHRKSNPFAQIAETLWMLSGRNDIMWLRNYIPQAEKYSDDGKTWRGAYGPRLRKWGEPGEWTVDQFQMAIRRLTNDINSRQTVLTIWDPYQDWIEGSKDYPCNDLIQFMVRNGKLHMFVYVRSNDAIWGFSHNDFFSWSVLQQMMARWVGVDVGNLHWNAASYHIYERHYELAEKIADLKKLKKSLYDYEVRSPDFTTAFPLFDRLMKELFNQYEQKFRMDAIQGMVSPELLDPGFSFFRDEFLDSAVRMLGIYINYKNSSENMNVVEAVEMLPNDVDFKYAAIQYLVRNEKFSYKDFTYVNADVERFVTEFFVE